MFNSNFYELMLNLKRNLIDWIISSPDRASIIILVITNFICNNIFLFNLKYYSDDWSLLVYPPSEMPISKALLDSQRPISTALFVLGQHIADNVLLFHLIAFITTTIAVVIIYFIFKRIFRDIGFESGFYPFIGAMIFCTLFNKDEIYAWPTLSFGFAYLAYILTIHLYLNKENKNYLGLSIFVYFLGLLSYEVGIVIPLFLLVYDYLIGKDWKKSFSFTIPLIMYLVIRFTKWFGYGWTGIDRGFGSYGLGLISTFIHSMNSTAYVFLTNFVNSICGYSQMDIALIVLLSIIIISLSIIIYSYTVTLTESKEFDIKLFFIAIFMIFVFSLPYLLRGGIDGATREFYLIDIGIALLIVCILMLIRRYFNIKILAILIIVLGIFVNQGLYYNWVVCGDILDNIDNFIGGNNDELLKYDYIYFNTSSYSDNIPNKFDMKMLFVGVRNRLFGSPHILIKQYDYDYNPYYNAAALNRWALEAMVGERKNTPYTLIYGNSYGTVPINVTDDTIAYKELPDGAISTISRNKVFEINYSSVVSFNEEISPKRR